MAWHKFICLFSKILTFLINAAVFFPGRTRGMEAPVRFNCSLTSSGSNCRKV